MKRTLGILSSLLLAAASCGGCAMCNNSWDEAYNAYGGAVERQDQFHGRVGSILSDPAMQYVEPGGRSDTPTEKDLYPADELGAPTSDPEIQ